MRSLREACRSEGWGGWAEDIIQWETTESDPGMNGLLSWGRRVYSLLGSVSLVKPVYGFFPLVGKLALLLLKGIFMFFIDKHYR